MTEYNEMSLEEKAEAAAKASIAFSETLAGSAPEALDWTADELDDIPDALPDEDGDEDPDEDGDEDPDEDEEPAGDGYDDMVGDDLREELRKRELPVSGTNDELVARLREDDAAKAQA